MKVKLHLWGIIILTSLFVISCDTPVRNRYPDVPVYQPPSNDDNVTGDNLNPTPAVTETPTTTPPSTTPPPTNTTTEDQGYSHCSDQMNFNVFYLGNFSLCKNSLNQDFYRFKFEQGSKCFNGICGTCFIPMHHDGKGSIQIGNAQCFAPEAGTIYYGNFIRKKALELNRVIAIAYSSLGAYELAVNSASAAIDQCMMRYQNQAYCSNVGIQYINNFIRDHANYYREVVY